MKIILTGVEVFSLAVFLSVYAIIQLAGVTVREKSAVRRHRAPQSADSDDSNGLWLPVFRGLLPSRR